MTAQDPCQACGESLEPLLQCARCGRARTPREIEALDYFRLFGLPRAYDVRRGDLEKAYLRLSREVHPDRAASEVPVGTLRRLAATVNEGYAVLKDPLRRADYLLGLLLPEEGGGARKMPPAFLQEQLALREAAETAGPEGRARLRETASQTMAAKQRELAALLTSPGAETLAAARALLDELRFYRTFLRDLEGVPR